MRLAALLPNTKLYGGVKRFFELGNAFIDLGHSFTIYTPDGTPPDWFDFRGEILTFSDLAHHELDVLFYTEIPFTELAITSKAKRKIYYHVRKKENLKKVLQHDGIEVFANSENLYLYDKQKFGINTFKAVGGINLDLSKFVPKTKVIPSTYTILIYGRLAEKRKGTHLVVRACELLYLTNKNIRLVLYDTPVNDKAARKIDKFKTFVPYEYVLNHPFNENYKLFNEADLYVSAERGAGWSNTCAEAMACGTPVIATSSGNKDFLIHNKTGVVVRRGVLPIYFALKKLLNDVEKQVEFSYAGRKEIEKYDWKKLAENIQNHLLSPLS